ncbi:prepilin-type N-terminal cleavage/methylation domain-containing protein [Candidatus Peregrinibacteria bacterium]|nr:prepilin-type N-terminal cleavage/methylation domain-containing protein [Candidatus Peregrinibacteria bacterium]
MKNIALKKKGFTLVEILIVISILSVVVILGLGSYSIVQKKIRLDVAANTLQSIIGEARDKSRSGYFVEKSSICYGFRVKSGEGMDLIKTKFDRLQEVNKCSVIESDITIVPTESLQSDLIIKKVEKFTEPVTEQVTVFFTPPYGTPELSGLRSDREALIKITVGYANSENPLDARTVVFNALIGNAYVQKVNENQNE